MKAVILAGGLGSRISEETDVRPKPMVEIGGKPILWHIMKIYAAHGITDFVICSTEHDDWSTAVCSGVPYTGFGTSRTIP